MSPDSMKTGVSTIFWRKGRGQFSRSRIAWQAQAGGSAGRSPLVVSLRKVASRETALRRVSIMTLEAAGESEARANFLRKEGAEDTRTRTLPRAKIPSPWECFRRSRIWSVSRAWSSWTSMMVEAMGSRSGARAGRAATIFLGSQPREQERGERQRVPRMSGWASESGQVANHLPSRVKASWRVAAMPSMSGGGAVSRRSSTGVILDFVMCA